MMLTEFDGIREPSIVAAKTVGSTGQIFYVNNSTVMSPGARPGADAGGVGLSPKQPFASINYAVSRCVANRGDIIYVLPGHVESVTAAAALSLAVAGIKIIFLGEGTNKATINFSTSVLADMDVDAANITMICPRFTAGIDALAAPIDVNASNFTLINPELVDGTGINTTRWIDVSTSAYVKIYGVTYVRGNEAGTQKESLIRVGAATDPYISDITCVGDFNTGVIENSTAWTNALLVNLKIENRNAGPKPGVALQATSTGNMYASHITVASGSVYVTAGSDMNFFESYGSNADAAGMEEIGTTISTSVEGKADTLIDYIAGAGIPSFPIAIDPGDGATLAGVVRRIHVLEVQIDQNLTGAAGIVTWNAGAAAGNGVSISESLRFTQEGVRQSGGTAMAAGKGVADALGTDGTTVTDSSVSVLGSIGANNNDNAFDSTNVVSNRDGSLLERTEYIINQGGAEGGTQYSGATDAGMVASTTAIVSADLSGYGDDFFNTKYYMQVIKNANSVGNAPEREVRQITDYVSATGTFTTDAFTVNVEASDNILILHESLVMIGRDDANNVFASTNVVANADGSLLERDQFNQEAIAAIQTDVGNPSARANFSSVETMIGVPDAVNSSLDDMLRTGFDSTAIAANIDGSIMERLEDIVVKVTAVDDYVDTEVAAIQTDIGDPSARTNFQSLEAMIGVPDSANSNLDDMIRTGFDSTAIGANVDGSALERLEHLKDIVTVLPNDSITAAAIANGAIDAATFAAGAIDAAAIADSSIDRSTFAVDTGLRSIESATAQAGAAGTITLVATASAVNDFYNGTIVLITGNTGVGQSRLIVDYDGATKVATVEPNWATAPDVTSTYAISPATEAFSAIGADNANNAYASANVAANVDGSVLERLEHLKDIVTVLPNNSITAAGIATGSIDADAIAADTILGADNNNNTFSSVSVVSNADGSIIERVEFVQEIVGVVPGTSLQTKIDDVQSDVGNPSARTNFQSLETMVGIPDAANSNLDDMLRTGFDSTAVASNRDGSVMERDEWNKDQFGTLVNTGGTASLSGILGDVANTSVASRLGTIEADTNTIEGASLAAAPTAGSLSRFVATGGTALGTQLPDSKSLYDMVRSYGRGYLVTKVYADLTGYDTVNAFTVTGDVEVQIIGVVGAVAITSTSGTTTLSLGTTEAPQSIIANSTIDNAQFAATDVWVDTSPSVDCELMPSAAWNIVGGGAAIALTRSADDITAGTLTLYCWWRPLSSNGVVEVA